MTRRLAIPWPLVAVAAATGVIGIAIVMSFSRGAWLGLAMALAVGLVLLHRRGFGAFVVGTGLVATLVLAGSLNLLPGAVVQRLGSVVESVSVFDARTITPTPENWATVERMANWQAAWAMFQDYPITGVGLGNFGVLYPDYALPLWEEFPAPHAHNYYLNLLAETGIVGELGYAVLMAAMLAWVLLVWYRSRRSGTVVRLAGFAVSNRAIAAGVAAAVVYVWTHSLLDDLFVHGITVQLALSLGILAPLADESR